MSSVGVKDAKAGLSSLVDEAASGTFVTITRHHCDNPCTACPNQGTCQFERPDQPGAIGLVQIEFLLNFC